nr:diacylglycerol kinase family protein [Exiguobacterium algae]
MEGVIHAIRTERNMRVHVIAACLVTVFAFWLETSTMENLILFGWVVAVFTLELVNTAIERTVDLVTTEIKPLAKRAKDVAAGAVLVASIGAAVTASVIFVPHLIAVWNML